MSRTLTLATSMLSLVSFVAAVGCTRTMTAQVTQPNPLIYPDKSGQSQSKKLVIDLKDMDLPRTFKLRQSASFAMVSRERLRFHVTLVHKWKEIADPTTWTVHLEDDRGHVYYPEATEMRYDDHVTRMWDWEQRSVERDTAGEPGQEFGYITKVHDDGWVRPTFLDSIDLFQGAGDYVFHAKELMNRGVKRLTLIMSRSGVEYHYTWYLADKDALGDEPVAATPPVILPPSSTN